MVIMARLLIKHIEVSTNGTHDNICDIYLPHPYYQYHFPSLVIALPHVCGHLQLPCAKESLQATKDIHI